MCTGTAERTPFHPPWRSSSLRRRPLSLHRRRVTISTTEARRKKRKDELMEMKNLKLYMENQSIMEENEKLRKAVLLLHQHNSALLLQVQQHFAPTPSGTVAITN